VEFAKSIILLIRIVGIAGNAMNARRAIMSKRVITAEVDQEWFDILGQLTRHQDGFVWIKVEEAENE